MSCEGEEWGRTMTTRDLRIVRCLSTNSLSCCAASSSLIGEDVSIDHGRVLVGREDVPAASVRLRSFRGGRPKRLEELEHTFLDQAAPAENPVRAWRLVVAGR